MATQDVLFPTDFERLYNKPFAYAGSTNSGGSYHIAHSPYKAKVRQEEHRVALQRSRLRKVKGGAGDFYNPAAQKLVALLVKKRENQYRELYGEHREPVAEPQLDPLFEELESMIAYTRSYAYTGRASETLVASIYRILQTILKVGFQFSAEKLERLRDDVANIQVVQDPDEQFRQSSNVYISDIYLIAIEEALKGMISVSNRSLKERKAYQSSLKKDISALILRKQREDLFGEFI
jgi:hypothetical protein